MSQVDIFVEQDKHEVYYATLSSPNEFSYTQIRKLYNDWKEQHFLRFKSEHFTPEWIAKTNKENLKYCKTKKERQEWCQRWEDEQFIENYFVEEWEEEHWEDLYPDSEDKAKAFIKSLIKQGWQVVETKDKVSLCIGYNIGVA